MHVTLITLVHNVKKEASKAGVDIISKFTVDKKSIVLSNEASGKVVLVGVVEVSGSLVTAAYAVNIEEWHKAEAKGYTREQIMDQASLASKIFTEVKIDNILKSLI